MHYYGFFNSNTFLMCRVKDNRAHEIINTPMLIQNWKQLFFYLLLKEVEVIFDDAICLTSAISKCDSYLLPLCLWIWRIPLFSAVLYINRIVGGEMIDSLSSDHWGFKFAKLQELLSRNRKGKKWIEDIRLSSCEIMNPIEFEFVISHFT